MGNPMVESSLIKNSYEVIWFLPSDFRKGNSSSTISVGRSEAILCYINLHIDFNLEIIWKNTEYREWEGNG
jgi:hypothetical protein